MHYYPWTIRSYQGPDWGLGHWYCQVEDDAREAFSSALRMLREEPIWRESGYYRDLEERGDCCGQFGEILFSTPMLAGDVEFELEHRAIGVLRAHDGRQKEFVILCLETKKRLYDEKGAKLKPDREFYERICPEAEMRLARVEESFGGKGDARYVECNL